MGLKQLDFFRKLNTDNDTSTCLGGLLTLIAFTLVSVLLVNETKLYLVTDLNYSAVIDNDSQTFMNIIIDITVKAPCLALSLDQQDEVGVHRLDVQDTLTKKRLDSKQRSVNGVWGEGNENYKHSEQELLDLIQAIKNQEQCRFTGYVKANKVPGNFHISYHAQHVLLQKLYARDLAVYKQLKLDHTIHSLQFGEDTDISSTLRRYPKAFQQYFKAFIPISRQSPENQKSDYEYQIKALPARFYDKDRKMQTLYKYSMTQADAPKGASEIDSIYFRYQISPVNMVYDIKTKNFYHFLVQLSAIIGGVFAVLGMLNSILQKFIS